MTEAVSLGELLHEEALLVLPDGSTPRTLIPVWTLPLRHISSSLSVARPFTNGVEWGWKKCTDPMVGGARSIILYDACTPSSVRKQRVLAPISKLRSAFFTGYKNKSCTYHNNSSSEAKLIHRRENF